MIVHLFKVIWEDCSTKNNVFKVPEIIGLNTFGGGGGGGEDAFLTSLYTKPGSVRTAVMSTKCDALRPQTECQGSGPQEP